MTEAFQIGLAVIAVLAMGVSYLAYGRSKVMQSNLDTMTKSNGELRDAIEFEQKQRVLDNERCDKAIAGERQKREHDRSVCDKEIANLQGRVDALTGDIGSVIASAVLKTIEVQGSVQGSQHAENSSRLDRIEAQLKGET